MFFFNLQAAEKLDSYQQLPFPEGYSHLYGVSGTGPKRMVALSGIAGVTDPWLDISNYGGICLALDLETGILYGQYSSN